MNFFSQQVSTTFFSWGNALEEKKPWYCTLGQCNGNNVLSLGPGEWWVNERDGFTPACFYQWGYMQSTDRKNLSDPTTLWGDDAKDLTRFWDFEVAPALEDVSSASLVYKVLRFGEIQSRETFVPGSDSYYTGWVGYVMVPARWQWFDAVDLAGYHVYQPVITAASDQEVLCFINPAVEFNIRGDFENPPDEHDLGKDNQTGRRKLGGKVPGNDAPPLPHVYSISAVPDEIVASGVPEVWAWSTYVQTTIPWKFVKYHWPDYSSLISQPCGAHWYIGTMQDQDFSPFLHNHFEFISFFVSNWLYEQWLRQDVPRPIGQYNLKNWRMQGALADWTKEEDPVAFAGIGLPNFPSWDDATLDATSPTWQYKDTSVENLLNPYFWQGNRSSASYAQLWGHLINWAFIEP